MGQVVQAAEAFEEAVAAAKRGADSSQLARSLEALGNLHRLRGRFSDALSRYVPSLALNREAGNSQCEAIVHLHIALVHLCTGHWKECDGHCRASLRIARSIGYELGEALVSLVQSRLHRRRGEFTEARDTAQVALDYANRTGYGRGVVLGLEELADVDVAEGQLDIAEERLTNALERARAIAPTGDLVYEVSWRLARVLTQRGRASDAQPFAEEASRLADASSDRREAGNARVALGLVHVALHRTETARQEFDLAIDEFRRIGTPYELAKALEASSSAETEPTVRRRRLEEARRLFSELGAAPALARLDRGRAPSEASSGPATEEVATALAFVTQDEEVERILALAADLAGTDATVLIEGETGTGKELVARFLHDAGPRADGPFLPLSCAEVSAQLIESELFGHQRGAFTGAVASRAGLFEAAQKGTLFLDEIDKAPLDLQGKLLRVIESRVVRPVGSSQFRSIDARIVCATNRDLKKLAEGGEFLQDLYYRLAGFLLRLPPLRERPGDVRVLAQHFLDEYASRLVHARWSLSPAVATALESYDWPGNVRELKNVMESSAFRARSDSEIAREHLPEDLQAAAGDEEATTLPAKIAAFERRHIVDAMRRANGVKTEAARILGVSRKGLLDRLRRLGLES
jgi:DNA-binding NtrC family response regulator